MQSWKTIRPTKRRELLLFGCALFYLSGCAFENDPDATRPLVTFLTNANVINAARELQRQGAATAGNCIACHGRGGTQTPFMHDNIGEAVQYIYTRGLVDESNANYIVDRSQDAHYTLGGGRRMDRQLWQVAATNLAVAIAAVRGAPPVGRGQYYTAPVQIPNPLPNYNRNNALNTANYKLMTIPLGSIHPSLNGVTIQLKIANELATVLPDSYIIYDVKVVNSTSNAIKIDGFYFSLNEQDNPLYGDLYAETHMVVPPNQNPTVSSLAMHLPKSGLTEHRITISFDIVELAPTMDCQHLDTFVNNIWPIFITANRLRDNNGNTVANTCIGCHGGGNAQAVAAMNLNVPGGIAGNPGLLCGLVLARTNGVNPATSAIMTKMKGPPAPIALYFAPADEDALIQWISDEHNR